MDFVQMLESMLPDGWEIDDPSYGSSCLLICPHGNTIEQDGTCPEGCVSPLRAMGMI
jgi:hypothetical protein